VLTYICTADFGESRGEHPSPRKTLGGADGLVGPAVTVQTHFKRIIRTKPHAEPARSGWHSRLGRVSFMVIEADNKRRVMKQGMGERSADIDLGFIDLNKASERDLAGIPWVGTERARNLIQHRPFKSMDEVRNVPGMTEDIIDQLIRGGATVGDPTPTGSR
jgi:hypothetical protein